MKINIDATKPQSNNNGAIKNFNNKKKVKKKSNHKYNEQLIPVDHWMKSGFKSKTEINKLITKKM